MNTLTRCLIFLVAAYLPAQKARAQVTDTYNSATTWTVPAGVATVSLKVYGGAGGTGGQDCGSGCTNAPAGPAGYVVAVFTVVQGDVLGIYPGGKGGNGTNNTTNGGGGTAGADTYTPANFNGGTGGNTGSSGNSGGGGGGGAASIVTLNSAIIIVAGGAGGGGGMANVSGSGQPGVSSTSSNGNTRGGNGTTPAADGGGGGGGGGGQFASAGGGVHAASAESAGDGGYRGSNSISGAASTTTNGTVAWTNAGRIQVTYISTVPVTWKSYTLDKKGTTVTLKWVTATESNTRDYLVERSDNGTDWQQIGTVPASGNSSTDREYEFADTNPLTGTSYYRLQQRDMDGITDYSKVLIWNVALNATAVRIYPNPVESGKLTVTLRDPARVSIYNGNGKRMIVKDLPAGKHMLDVSSLPGGSYILTAANESLKFLVH